MISIFFNDPDALQAILHPFSSLYSNCENYTGREPKLRHSCMQIQCRTELALVDSKTLCSESDCEIIPAIVSVCNRSCAKIQKVIYDDDGRRFSNDGKRKQIPDSFAGSKMLGKTYFEQFHDRCSYTAQYS